MQRVRMYFSKSAGARYLSHLDLLSTFEYSMRRARLPISLSEGFNPRPRMSLASPLPLGYVGDREILEIALREPLTLDTIKEQLQAAVPPGIGITSIEDIPEGEKSAASRLRSGLYRIHLPAAVPDLAERVADLLDRTELPIEEDREGKTRTRDVRPLILSVEAAAPDTLLAEVRLADSGSVRPEQILGLLAVSPAGAEITRLRISLDP